MIRGFPGVFQVRIVVGPGPARHRRIEYALRASQVGQSLLDEIVLSGFAILKRARRKGNRWKKGGGMSGIAVEMTMVVAANAFHGVWLEKLIMILTQLPPSRS